MSAHSFTPGPQALAAALSPDTAPELLFYLAELYPEEVLSNVALPLLLIEDPQLHLQVCEAATVAQWERRINNAAQDASLTTLRLWACDCVERVIDLGIIPAHLVGTARALLSIARSAARDLVDDATRDAAHGDAGLEMELCDEGSAAQDAWIALYHLTRTQDALEDAPLGGAVCAAYAVAGASAPFSWAAVFAAERAWQEARLAEYLKEAEVAP